MKLYLIKQTGKDLYLYITKNSEMTFSNFGNASITYSYEAAEEMLNFLSDSLIIPEILSFDDLDIAILASRLKISVSAPGRGHWQSPIFPVHNDKPDPILDERLG